MEKPRVTYILATYNREAFLEKAFKNFREFIDPAQDEFIVIDGASTDKSLEILNRHRDLITTLISEPDQGEAHAFNKGLMIARGEIIKVLTDDDYFYPSATNEAINLLLNDKKIEALICGGRLIDNSGSLMKIRGYQNFNSNIPYSSKVENIFDFGGCGLGLFFKKRIISIAGLFDTSFYSVDGEYIARLIEKKIDIKFFRIHLFDHITQPSSGVKLGQKKIQRDWLKICLRSRLFRKATTYWLVWNVRARIPTPFRYLWRLQSRNDDLLFWNDKAIL